MSFSNFLSKTSYVELGSHLSALHIHPFYSSTNLDDDWTTPNLKFLGTKRLSLLILPKLLSLRKMLKAISLKQTEERTPTIDKIVAKTTHGTWFFHKNQFLV